MSRAIAPSSRSSACAARRAVSSVAPEGGSLTEPLTAEAGSSFRPPQAQWRNREMSIIEGEPVAAPASVSLEIGGKEITFETGKLAKQADGAVVIRSGDTMVLATAQGRTEGREGADFFPLTIDVEERMYAAGKIPGGFFK